jgi:two-component system, NarL family, sensor histidine kinase BarA
MSGTWRIKHRLLALALLPAVAVAVVLTVYWSVVKIQQLEESMVARGNTIVGFLAPAAEYGVISGNRAFLRSASSRVRSEPDLVSIRITDEHGNLLYTYVQDLRPGGRLHGLSGLLFGHGVRDYEAPITLSSLEGYDGVSGLEGGGTDTAPQVIGHVRISLSTVPTAVTQTEWILRSVVIILVLLAVTAIVARRLESPLSGPLEEMAEAVHRIGRGDLEARVQSRGGGELDQLADGINNMARNIGRSHARMTERVQASTRDLQEQIKLIDEKNRALTIARTQADEANLKKSRLLANISHELRTPLSAIQGYSELLAQHGNLDERQESWLSIINTSSRDTLKLVNDLLDVSRLESGRIGIQRTEFELNQCLSEVIGICRRSPHGRTVDVTLVMEPETPTRIHSDKLRFKQVITNILSNALKFTLDGRVHVHTRLRQTDGRRQLEIGVRDFGPGIDPEELPHIFEPFFQSRDPDRARRGGAGLGLSITRGIVKLLGGQVLVDSTPGSGSLFTVLLPLTDADVPLPTPTLPAAVASVFVWSDESEIRRALLETLEVLRLPAQACKDLDDYLKRLGGHAQSIGIIWVRQLAPGEAANLKTRGPVLARTLLARSVSLGERLTSDLATHGAHLIPLTLSVGALNRAIQDMMRPATPAEHPKRLTEPGASRSRLEGYTFLVADDNAVNRRLLTEFLQRHGGRVTQAEDGDSAVSAYASNPPDLVFMDVHMPVKDGIAALEEIRASDAGARIVAVTADLRPETHISLLQHGFDRVLYKPVSEADLLSCVEGAPVVNTPSRRRAPAEFDTNQPVHDEDVALQRAGGNPRLARDMLQMLIRDVQRVRAHLDETPARGAVLLEMVHRIHGGARYCGTLRLAACSQALEMALKGRQADRAASLRSVWTAEMDTLLAQADTLLASLDRSAADAD